VKELKEIVNATDAAARNGTRVALASVVHLDGSSYRRPGARMLVTDEGEMTGAISGGCLEGDALRKAMHAISQGNNRLITYDTTDEDDMSIGIQLGCAGVIQVLFEPVDIDRPDNPIELIRKVNAVRQACVLVTLFDLSSRHAEQPGTCMLMESDGSLTGTLPNVHLREEIIAEMTQVLHHKRSVFKSYRSAVGSMTAFIEYLRPPVSMVIVGAGNDAIPMLQIAETLGWDVRIVDGRNTHARPERFVAACQVLVSKPEAVLDQIPIDDRTVFVMMTHNYNYDKAMLKALLQTEVPYIGMLGPKKKLQRMLDDMKAEDFIPDDGMMSRVFGPAGLEIDAETPEEIALSIIAEIQAVFGKKPGGMLRDKADVIHSRTDIRIETIRIN
jgi:xanthine dehydrogenase accessory factor